MVFGFSLIGIIGGVWGGIASDISLDKTLAIDGHDATMIDNDHFVSRTTGTIYERTQNGWGEKWVNTGRQE